MPRAKPLTMVELVERTGMSETQCRARMRAAGVRPCGERRTRPPGARGSGRPTRTLWPAEAVAVCRRAADRKPPTPPRLAVRGWHPASTADAHGHVLDRGELPGMPAHCRPDVEDRILVLRRRADAGLPLFGHPAGGRKGGA